MQPVAEAETAAPGEQGGIIPPEATDTDQHHSETEATLIPRDQSGPAADWGVAQSPSEAAPGGLPIDDHQMAAAPTALLAPSPFETSETAAADLSPPAAGDEAEPEGTIESPAEVTVAAFPPLPIEAAAETAEPETSADAAAATTAEPDVAAAAEPFEEPHEEILAGAWETAVKPPEEAVRSRFPARGRYHFRPRQKRKTPIACLISSANCSSPP
jgi:hypothetical protein